VPAGLFLFSGRPFYSLPFSVCRSARVTGLAFCFCVPFLFFLLLSLSLAGSPIIEIHLSFCASVSRPVLIFQKIFLGHMGSVFFFPLYFYAHVSFVAFLITRFFCLPKYGFTYACAGFLDACFFTIVAFFFLSMRSRARNDL